MKILLFSLLNWYNKQKALYADYKLQEDQRMSGLWKASPDKIKTLYFLPESKEETRAREILDEEVGT